MHDTVTRNFAVAFIQLLATEAEEKGLSFEYCKEWVEAEIKELDDRKTISSNS